MKNEDLNKKNSRPNEPDVFSENEMFEIIDSLTNAEGFNLNIDDEDFFEDKNFNDIKESISKKTFEKLGLEKKSTKNSCTPVEFYKTPLFKKLIAVAASIAIVFSIFTTDYVKATIKKLFKYIPGINQTIEDEGDIYILNKPVKVSDGNSYIKLLSVVIDTEKQFIYVGIRGNNNKCKKASVRFKNGKEYGLPMYSIAGGGEEWVGNFSYDSKFHGNKNTPFVYNEYDGISIIIDDNKAMTFNVKLVKADSYKSYEELGPTALKNGLSITAIPAIEGKELKLNLLTPHINNQGVEDYGLRPDYTDAPDGYRYGGLLAERITLKDKKGNTIKGRGLNSYAPPLGEFYFNISESKDKEFKLTIPYIKMRYDVDKDVKIKLPKLGEKLEYNNIVDLNGYKLNITSVERPEKNRVIINIDTNYDESSKESLFFIEPGVKFSPLRKPIYNGWSGNCAKGDEKIIGPMNQLDIQLEKENIDEFNLNIKSIITIKRGPWEFDISLDELSK